MREIILKAKEENLGELTAWADEQLEAAGCPANVQLKIDLAIEEIFCNIAAYAYPGTEGDVRVTLELRNDRTAVLTFCDTGTAFDPLLRKEPDVSLSAEERSIGGLGIFLVRKTMDKVEYVREDGQNILRILKKF